MLLPLLAAALLLAPVPVDRLGVGDPAPALSIDHFVKGEALDGYAEGKVTVVEFWATWCAPCIENFPHLSELQERWPDELVVIGVSDEPLPVVEAFLGRPKHADVTRYRMASDPDGSMSADFMRAAGLSGIPAAFVIDRAGVLQFVGHPAGMDVALERVISGVAAAPDEPLMSDALRASVYAVPGAHDEAAAVWTERLLGAWRQAGDRVSFEQTLVLAGALRMGGPDGEAMDLELRRTGDLEHGGDLGDRVDASRTMVLPGMPGGGMTEHETVLLTDDRVLLRRGSDSPFMPSQLPDAWMSIARADATALADRAPMPVPALACMDLNPVLADPLDVLARVFELCALVTTEGNDGRLVLAGLGAPFLGMPSGVLAGDELPPVAVRVEVAGAPSGDLTLLLGDAAKPVLRMELRRSAVDAAFDPTRFSIGDEQPQALLPVLEEQLATMRRQAAGG